MKNITELFKTWIPHIIAISIFILLGIVYFSPQLKDYALHQGDINNHIGMSKEVADYREKFDSEPLWTNSMFGGMPSYQISVKYNTNYIAAVEHLTFKLLNSPLAYIFLSMLGFYVLLLCMNISPWLSIIGAIAFGFSTINILYLGAGHNTKVHAIALLPLVVGGVFYTYRRNMITGGILTSLFLCLHLSANHVQETYYLLFFLLGLAVVEFIRHFKEKQLPKFAKASSILIIAALIGVLPTISSLLTTNEYGKFTTRGKSELTITNDSSENKTEGLDRDYIKQYSLGFGEVWSLVIPNVKGGASGYLGNYPDKIKEVDPRFRDTIAQSSSYWGEQLFTGGAFYFGASIFLMFILGLIFIKDPIKWAIAGVSALAIILSWKFGSILDFFITHVPLFSKFRDTKMMLVLVQVAFPLLGLLFIKDLTQRQYNIKKLLYAIGGVLGVFCIIYITPDTWFDFFSTQETAQFEQQISTYGNNSGTLDNFYAYQDSLKDVRISIFRDDVLRSILFILIAGLFVLAFVMKKLKQSYLIIGLGLLILVDLWGVDKRYLNNEKARGNYISWQKKYEKKNPFTPSVADKAILSSEIAQNPDLVQIIENESKAYFKENKIKRKHKNNEKDKIAFRELGFVTDYRVFSLENPFNDSKISYFHKSIGGYHGAKLKKYQELIDFRISKEYQSIVNVLNKKDPISLPELLRTKLPTLNMLNTKYIIYNSKANPIANPFANGNAWFVNDIKYVDNADEEILALNTIDPKRTAVINRASEGDLELSFTHDPTAKITLTQYLPNHLTYNSNSQKPQLAVFSEIYYKDGWNAYIDGELVSYYKVNYVLRAMLVPEGKHTVEFKFEPKTFRIGENISVVGSILLLLLIIGGIIFKVKDYFKNN